MTKMKDMLPPDTKSVMAGYKEPLRKVEDGFGYYGTLAYDETEEYTQCHVCGNFFTSLYRHIRDHELSMKDYREQFGIGLSVSLTAPKRKVPQFVRWENYSDEKKAEILAKMKKGRENWKQKNGKHPGADHKAPSLYHKNLGGRCPDQLLDKIVKLAEKQGSTPTNREFKKEYGAGMIESMKLTYGSWGQALDILGLPRRKSMSDPRYSPESLIEMLRDFRDRTDREAMSSDLHRGLLPDQTTFTRYFGSWSNAKIIAYGGEGNETTRRKT